MNQLFGLQHRSRVGSAVHYRGQNQYPDSGEWFELQVKSYPHQRERSLFSDSLFEAAAGGDVIYCEAVQENASKLIEAQVQNDQ